MNDDIKEAIQEVKAENIDRVDKIEERMSEGFKDIKESLHEFREDMNLKFLEFERKHDEAAQPFHEMLAKHDEIINGNGKEGMKTKLSKIEEKLGNYTKVVWICVAGVIAGIIEFIFKKTG